MSLVLLAGYMNTYTSNPAPIDPTGGFAGNTVTPFDYGGGREPLQQHRVDR